MVTPSPVTEEKKMERVCVWRVSLWDTEAAEVPSVTLGQKSTA